MPRAGAFLGIDVGTSAVKALLVTAAGETRAVAGRPLVIDSPTPLAAEQDADDWWRAAAAAVRDVMRAARGVKVAAVGLTGQKHALLALDARGRPLAPAVLWADGRAAKDARRLDRSLPSLARSSGGPALPGFLVPKWLRWRREDEALARRVVRRVARLCFAKDYVRLRLTGTFATDPTEASASRLAGPAGTRWSAALAARFSIPFDALPPIVPSTGIAGRVHAAGERATGIPAGTPVAAGAGDNEAGALACGAVDAGLVAVMLGTSATVVAPARRLGPVGGLVWGAHALPGRLAATGTVLSAGRALEWIRAVAFPSTATVADVLREAQAADPTAAPLVFLPDLVGERSPVPDPFASGAFVGLRPTHRRGHLARAVLEGVALSIGGTIDLLRDAGVPVREIRLTSGGAASPLWRGLIAAAARAPVRPVGAQEGPALGAAILAAGMPADGVLAGAATAADLARISRRWVQPGPVERPSRREIDRMHGLAAASARARTGLCGAFEPA